VQVKIPVVPPVLRVTVIVFSDALQVTNVDAANTFLNTPLDDVFGETVEEVGAAFRPLFMQTSRTVTTRVVALGDFFREVIPVLLQPVAGVQLRVFSAVGDGGEVTDTKVDTCCLLAGSRGCLNLVVADEVQLPPLFLLVIDGANLLEVLDRDIGSGFVFDEDVVSLPRIVFVEFAFREPDAVVFRILLPRG
jgi:hypothetical protein